MVLLLKARRGSSVVVFMGSLLIVVCPSSKLVVWFRLSSSLNDWLCCSLVNGT